MITAEDTYAVADKILEIPITQIRPATDNVRTDLGDLAGLAASIREVGVLQAITIVPAGDDFVILMGARRYAAAQLAGLMTIPAVIRTRPEDAKRVMTMLIENVQRSDLTPLDEARTFARLENDFELDQADIANRVGCSQSHVSKRLSLLTLPEKAQTMVVAGELNIGDAVELAKLADTPKRLEAALDKVTKHDWEPSRAVAAELAELAGAEALAKAKADCKAKKIPILHIADRGGMNYTESEKKKRALEGALEVVKAGGHHYGRVLELDKPAQHTKEPCHAVTLAVNYDGKVGRTAYCTAPKRHNAKGDSALKAAKSASSTEPKRELDPEAKAYAEGRAAATAARHAFAHELIRDHKLDRPAVTARALQTFAMTGWERDHTARATLLGLDLNGRQPTQALADYASGGTDNLIRSCLAVLIIDGLEPRMHRNDDPLAVYGYELTDWERSQFAEEEADRARDDAWNARDLALERAEELEDGPDGILERVAELTCELDEGCSAARGVEIQAAFDAMFVELNDIQPGDVVDHDGEGHTIERAVDNDDPNPDAVLCAFPHCTLDDEHDGDHQVPEEVEVHAAPAPTDDHHPSDTDVNGSFELPAEGAAASALLTDYAKAPKDRGDIEAKCATRVDMALGRNPANIAVLAIQQELYAGVDEDRAADLFDELNELLEETRAEYSGPAINGGEKRCRQLIADLDPTIPRVVEIQQILYRGRVSIADAGVLRTELQELLAEHGKKA